MIVPGKLFGGKSLIVFVVNRISSMTTSAKLVFLVIVSIFLFALLGEVIWFINKITNNANLLTFKDHSSLT